MAQQSLKSSPVAQSLKALVGFAYRHPLVVLGLALVWFLLSLALAATRLEFATDRAALVDANERFRVLANRFAEEFPDNDDTVVVVEGATQADRQAFVEDLAARLRAQPDAFRAIFYKVELPFLKTHALFYLSVDDLKKLVAALREAKSMLAALSSDQGVGELLHSSTTNFEKVLPILNEILSQLLTCLQSRGRYHYNSPWEKALFEINGQNQDQAAFQEAGQTSFYNTLNGGEKYLLLVRFQEPIDGSLQRLRQEVRRLRPSFPGLDVGITGELVLDNDEMQSSTSDSARATVWSLVLVSVMFAFAFRQALRPLMVLVALILGVGWTIGFTTLAVGHLNLLTVTFATILVGLGVDFGIHFIYRYEEERTEGHQPLQAMERCMEGAGVENFTGALTTAVAFWAIRFTDFRGVAELGLISGTGVMLCFLSMASVLPALLFLQERHGQVPAYGERPDWAEALSALERWYLSRPWPVIGLSLYISIWAALQVPQVAFDYNLLNLQSHKLPSVLTELNLIATDNHGVLFAVDVADDIATAKSLTERFSKLPSVSRVESVLPLVPSDYARKAPLIHEVVQLMAPVPLPSADGPANSGTRKGLTKMGQGFADMERAFREAYPRLLHSPDVEVRKEAVEFDQLLNRLFKTLEKMGPGVISDGVSTFQADLYSDLRAVLEFLKSQRATPPVTLNDLPEGIRLRSLGKTGKILLRIYPRENPWEREPLGRFVHDLQSVDPDVIGTPIMIFYHTEALKRAYEVSGWYAFGAIALILLLHFRNLTNTLLALLPKVVGILWMLGLMGHYHVMFNPANFMALPLILGIGLIFGVHVVHRLLHDPQAGIFSHSTGPAIGLSALTTMAGFGTLMMAQHEGIASLGFLMTAGVGANLVTSLLLLPAVMRAVSGPRRN